MNMYEVCAKCGHVGRDNYIDKVFAIKAMTGKEAAAIARQLPRVKHHHKDAIRYVREIDSERYKEIMTMLKEDPYMQCRNIQEQRARCELRVCRDEHTKGRKRTAKAEGTGKSHYHHKKKIRNPKKYINNYISFEEYVS